MARGERRLWRHGAVQHESGCVLVQQDVWKGGEGGNGSTAWFGWWQVAAKPAALHSTDVGQPCSGRADVMDGA